PAVGQPRQAQECASREVSWYAVVTGQARASASPAAVAQPSRVAPQSAAEFLTVQLTTSRAQEPQRADEASEPMSVFSASQASRSAVWRQRAREMLQRVPAEGSRSSAARRRVAPASRQPQPRGRAASCLEPRRPKRRGRYRGPLPAIPRPPSGWRRIPCADGSARGPPRNGG